MDHSDLKDMFKIMSVRMVKPEIRIDPHLEFRATELIALSEISRWMKHGSIVPFVEQLGARTGKLEREGERE